MSSKYTVYSQQGFKCRWCEKATALLDQLGEAYELRALTRPELRKKATESGMTSIPIIYHNNVLVGGYVELDSYLQKQKAA